MGIIVTGFLMEDKSCRVKKIYVLITKSNYENSWGKKINISYQQKFPGSMMHQNEENFPNVVIRIPLRHIKIAQTLLIANTQCETHSILTA